VIDRLKKGALIHILDKQTDEIIGTLDVGEYDGVRRSSLDNKNQFDFVAFRHFDILQKRNRVLVRDADGFFHEYIITFAEQQDRYQKHVMSDASFIDLAKAKVIEPRTLEGQTSVTIAPFILSGTEWQVGEVEHTITADVVIENYTNPYDLLKKVAEIFGLEIRFRVEIQGNKITGRYVDLKKQIAGFEGKEIEFGKDLIGIARKEDNSRIVTALLGVGPQREDGTRLTVFVEDKDALARWGRNGQHLVDVYEVESSDANMTLEQLTELTEAELKKRIDSIVSYEGNAAAIEHIPGFSHEKIRLGQTVRIKDIGYTPPLYVEARIQEIEENPATRQILSFKLGNFVEYKKEDLEKQIKLLKELMAQKASSAAVQQAMEYAEQKAQEAEDNAKQHADNVAQQAEQNAKLHAEQKAAEAQAAAEAVARAEAELAETQAKVYADGIVTAEEQARIQQAQQNLAEAKAYAEQKAQEAQDAAEQYVNTQLTNYVTAVMYQQDIAELQNQIDGNITSWFYAHEPTLTNEPAVNWTTNNLKNQHLGDIFYNTSNGYSYRFAYENGTYKWLLLKDSDVQKALADAAKAQDTADAKRRVFVSQPVPPYDVGDLWVQGTSGDIMRCQTAKVAGQAYSSSDWVKASKYTDDTRAIQAEINAKSHADTIAEQKKQEAIAQAIADAEAKVNQAKTELEADIATKADAEWVNGQLQLKENAIHRGATAPTDTTKLWLDTSVVPNVLKRYDSATSSWVKASATTAGEVGAYTKSEVDNALNSKVSITQYTTDMNGVVTRLDSAESRITQTEQEIATKVSVTQYEQDKQTIEGNISSLQTRMANAETQITQNASQIALKANKTDVYTKTEVNNQLANKADNTTVNDLETRISEAEAQLTIQANEIASRVTQTEFNNYKSTNDANVSDLQTRMSNAESTITQHANQIALKVSQSQYDIDIPDLQSRMSSAESTITQLADEIELKVNKDGVIAAINLSSEQAKISAAKILLDGYVEAKHIKSLEGLNVNDQFIVENGNVKFSGSLEGASGTFNGELTSNIVFVGTPNSTVDDTISLAIRKYRRISETVENRGVLLIRAEHDTVFIEGADPNGVPSESYNPTRIVFGNFPVQFSQIEVGNFINATLINGWTRYSTNYDIPGFMKDPLGFVHLRGAVKGGMNSSTIFTLPVGYRPSMRKNFSVAAGASGTEMANITIMPDGSVTVWGPDISFVSLDDVPPFYVGFSGW
jgi:phage minor structural protein